MKITPIAPKALGDSTDNLEAWLRSDLWKKLNTHDNGGAGGGGGSGNAITLPSATAAAVNKVPRESPLRADARLIKTLEAVRDGTKSVADAALEIIKAKAPELIAPIGVIKQNVLKSWLEKVKALPRQPGIIMSSDQAEIVAKTEMEQAYKVPALMGMPVRVSPALKPDEIILVDDEELLK